MLEIKSIFMFSVGICIVCIVLKELKSVYAALCALSGAIIICVLSLTQFEKIYSFLSTLQHQSGLPGEHGIIIFKILGISILSEVSISLCRDQHHTALGDALDIFSKCSVILLSLPIFEDVLDAIGALLG